MNTILIDNKTLNEWFDLTNSILKSDSSSVEEFEIRLQSITLDQFNLFKNVLGSSSTSILTTKDTIYSSNLTKTSVIREIIPIQGEKLYQIKEKLSPYDTSFVSLFNPIKVQGIRISKSFETNISKYEFDEKTKSILQPNMYQRKRTRTTFMYNKFHIDCTEVESSNSKITYEVEIESDISINNLQECYHLLKESLHCLYPSLHTLFTPEKYKGILKTIESKVLPNVKQPINIQEKHMNKLILDYSITNKLDGTNYKCFFLKGKSYFILHNSTDMWIEKSNSVTSIDCVLNVEVTKDNNIHIFDIIQLENEPNILKESLTTRIEKIKQILSTMSNPFIKCKTFFTSKDIIKNICHCIQYMTETYGINITQTNTETGVEYFNDGIIFQYNGEAVFDKKSNIIPSLKWKFPSKITIDFLAKQTLKTKHSITYALYSKQTKASGESYFVQFQTQNGLAELTVSLPNTCDGIDCSELNDKVLEVGWDDLNNQFKLFRIRTDKTADRTNHLFVAKETFPQMIDKFTLPKCIQSITKIRNDILSDYNSSDENMLMYIKGKFPFKKNYKDEENTLIDIQQAFKKLEAFNIFKNDRIKYEFMYYNPSINKTFYNIVPGIHINNKSLRNIIYQYKTKNGKYLAIETLPEDYNQIDKITDYFTEDIRLKAIVKSESISPLDYFGNNEDEIIQKLKDENIPLTNYNVREEIFKSIKETTLFKTTFCKSIIQLLSPDNDPKQCKWLDISAGWGDRLITAIASKVKKYVAFDPNDELKDGQDKIIRMFGNSDFERYHIIYEPAELGIKKINKLETFNLIFSSPPFFDFEIYSNKETQSSHTFPKFQTWLKDFLFATIYEAWKHLENGGKLAIYIVDIGQYNIVEPLFQYIEKECKGSNYLGMITSLVKFKIPKPVWVWEKNIKTNEITSENNTETINCEENLKNFRKYHNEIKAQLINKVVNNKIVLDLGSGRGGDIQKYIHSKAKFVTFVEPSEENITELKSRLSKSVLKNKSEVFLSPGESFQQEKETKYDVISLFYMLTFFFSDEDKLQQLINVISNQSKENTYIIGTTANGNKMFQLLKETPTVIENCYTIESVNVKEENAFGQSIIIDLKSTKTATYQKEYLVFKKLLIEYMNKASFSCIFFKNSEPQSYLSESENKLSQLYAEFMFQKVSTINIQNIQFIEGTSPEDGSCFFHSVLQLLKPDIDVKKEGLTLRKKLASLFELEDYISLQNGTTALTTFLELLKQHSTKLEKSISTKTDKSSDLYKRIEKNSSNITNVMEIFELSSLSDKEKEYLEGLLIVSYESFVNKLNSCKEWADSWMIEFICKQLECNIIIIDSKSYKAVSSCKINIQQPFIFVMNIEQTHYVPLFGMNGIRIFSYDEVKQIVQNI